MMIQNHKTHLYDPKTVILYTKKKSWKDIHQHFNNSLRIIMEDFTLLFKNFLSSKLFYTEYISLNNIK